MPIKQIKVATCDKCSTVINLDSEVYVDASVYGVAFHKDCWFKINGPEVARLLGIDDVYYYLKEVRQDRAWAPYEKKD